MGNIDGLKEQVEQLKQRLNDPGAQQMAAPDELKTRLASIKQSLESQQGEIAQLSAEKQQLADEKQQLTSDKVKYAAELQRLSSEVQRLSGENEQLRKMLKDLLSALDGRPADAATSLLSEFLAETDSLLDPKDRPSEPVIAAGPPAEAPAERPSDAAQAAEPAAEAPEEEESPALRRIMKRGRRVAG